MNHSARKRLVIDARFLGPDGTGLGRYTDRLLDHLQDMEYAYDVRVLVRSESSAFFQVRNDAFSKVILDAKWYTLKEQRALPALLRREGADLVHYLHMNVARFSRTPFLVTIHDLTKSTYKDQSASTRNRLVFEVKHAAYRSLMRYAVRAAEHMFVPTEFVKNEVQRAYPDSSTPITVTYEGVEPFLHTNERIEYAPEEEQAILAQYGVKRPYMIYVGNSYPYKNIDLVLDALPHLPENLSFVNPCARSTFYDRLADTVRQRGLASRVVLPGFVPDEALSVLYRHAELLVFPSLSEGFGLPGLEAMMEGVPVVSSHASCLPEVFADAAVYFDPHSVDDLVRAVRRVRQDTQLRETLIQRGYERVQQFSWRRMAQQTKAVYDQVLCVPVAR